MKTAGSRTWVRRAITRTMVLAFMAGTMSACVWRGYRPPDANSVHPIGQYPPCPAVGVQNLSTDHATIIRAAAADVCAVLRHDEFRRLVEQESLRETCQSPARISGRDLHRALLAGLPPSFSVVARKPWWAEAVTDPVNNRIAIRLGRFDAWRLGGEARGEMINTLAHELTHLVRAGPGSRFQDRGHGTTACPDDSLVSYRLGDIAEQVWRTHVMNRPG